MKRFSKFVQESVELEEQSMTFQDAEKLKGKHLVAADRHKKSGNSKGYAAHTAVVSKFEDAYDRHGTGVIPAGRILAASQKAFKDHPHSSMKESVELDEAWSDGVSSRNAHTHRSAAAQYRKKANSFASMAKNHEKGSPEHNKHMAAYHSTMAKSIKSSYHAGDYGSMAIAKKDHKAEMARAKEYKSTNESIELDEASTKVMIPKSRYLTILKAHGPQKLVRTPKGEMKYRGAEHHAHNKDTDTHIIQTYSHPDHNIATIERHKHHPTGETRYYMYRRTQKEDVDLDEGISSFYHKVKAKSASRKADDAFDAGKQDDFVKHMDKSTYHKLKAGQKVHGVRDKDKFMNYYKKTYGEDVDLDEAVKIGSKVRIHAPGKDYHGKVGHVGEIRKNTYGTWKPSYTVDYHEPGEDHKRSVTLSREKFKMHKEEVEQIDEISASTLRSYVDKARASRDTAKKDRTQAKGDMKKYGNMPGDRARHDAAQRKMVNRAGGISVANKKLGTYPTDRAKAKVMAREEVDVNESAEMSLNQKRALEIGRKLQAMAPKEKNDMISNAMANLGDHLESFGATFGAKNMADLVKKTGLSKEIIATLIRRAQK